MNNFKINKTNITLLSSGQLANGKGYKLVALDSRNLQAIYDFHQAAIASLQPHEKTYMLPKSYQDFENHIQKSNGNAILGLIVDDQLIGMAMVNHPSTDDENAQDTSLIQAVCISPDYRGQNLMQILIDEWIHQAEKYGRTNLEAEVDVNNIASWNSFLKSGFNLVSIALDQNDGSTIYNVHETLSALNAKKLSPTFNRHADVMCAQAVLEDQKTLIEHGYVITGFDKDKKVMMLKNRKPS